MTRKQLREERAMWQQIHAAFTAPELPYLSIAQPELRHYSHVDRLGLCTAIGEVTHYYREGYQLGVQGLYWVMKARLNAYRPRGKYPGVYWWPPTTAHRAHRARCVARILKAIDKELAQ